MACLDVHHRPRDHRAGREFEPARARELHPGVTGVACTNPGIRRP